MLPLEWLRLMPLPLIPIAIGGTAFGGGLLLGRETNRTQEAITGTLTSFSNISKIAVLMIAIGGVYYISKRAKG